MLWYFTKLSIHELKGIKKFLYHSSLHAANFKGSMLTTYSTIICAHACLLQKPVFEEENQDEFGMAWSLKEELQSTISAS